MIRDTYRHTFKKNLSDKEKTQILNLAKSSILNRVKADVYLSWDDLHFVVPFWIGRQNLFAMVDKGKFTFNNSNTLTYEISHLKTLILGISFALILAIGTGQTVLVLSIFGILVILNWLISKLRHISFFKEIISNADNILGER